MRELQEKFTGIGEVRGIEFTQIKKSPNAYIYECKDPDSGQTYYEVFQRKENSLYQTVSYPSSKSFGITAWTEKSLCKAIERFNWIDNGYN